MVLSTSFGTFAFNFISEKSENIVIWDADTLF